MPASTPATRDVLRRWLHPLISVALGACSAAALANATIQITPLPEQHAAIVTQLGAHELSTQDTETWFDGMLAYALPRNQITGAQVVVVKDGNIVLAKGYGYADVAAKKPVDPHNTLFRAGSVSKLFTATAVMQLVEAGKLDLDADVNRYLDFGIPPRDGKPVTLRELLTHSAGFEERAKNLLADADTANNEAWLKQWMPTRVYPAGEVAAYSNYGMALAGYIVQRVSGQPFDQYVAQHIFQPLHMQHATFAQPLPAALKGDMASSYASPYEPAKPFEMVAPAPAGGLSVSGGDIAQFMLAELADGHGQDGSSILRPETLRQMQGHTRVSVPDLHAMALGFQHMDRNGQVIIGHDGDTRYFHTALLLFPQQRTGVFVAFDGAQAGGFRRLLVNAFTDRYFPALPQKPEPTLASAKAHGVLVEGRYLPSRTSLDNPRSLLNLFNQSPVTMAADGTLRTPDLDALMGPVHWREVKPFVWLDDVSGSHLGFAMQDGKPRWFSIDELAPTQVFLPLACWQSAPFVFALIGVLFAIFLLVGLLWPLAALVRRAHAKPFALRGAAAYVFRLSRVVAILQLVLFAGWAWAMPHLAFGDTSFDTSLRLLQTLGWLAIFGLVALALNAWFAWRQPGGWWRRVNSTILLLAGFGTLWLLCTYHLLGGVNY